MVFYGKDDDSGNYDIMQTVIDEYLQNKVEAQADYEAMLAQ